MREFDLSRSSSWPPTSSLCRPFDEVKQAIVGRARRAQSLPRRALHRPACRLGRALRSRPRRRWRSATGPASCSCCSATRCSRRATRSSSPTPRSSSTTTSAVRHEAKAVTVPLVDFAHDLEAMAAAVTPRTKMLIVCNPNNPTGTYVPVADIARLVERVPNDVLVVIDEAYNEFVTAADSQDALALQAAHDNVVVLRTFSKIYGLCGLRVGYGLGSPGAQGSARQGASALQRQPARADRRPRGAQAPGPGRGAARDQRRTARLPGRTAGSTRAARPCRAEANFMLVYTRGSLPSSGRGLRGAAVDGGDRSRRQRPGLPGMGACQRRYRERDRVLPGQARYTRIDARVEIEGRSS